MEFVFLNTRSNCSQDICQEHCKVHEEISDRESLLQGPTSKMSDNFIIIINCDHMLERGHKTEIQKHYSWCLHERRVSMLDLGQIQFDCFLPIQKLWEILLDILNQMLELHCYTVLQNSNIVICRAFEHKGLRSNIFLRRWH